MEQTGETQMTTETLREALRVYSVEMTEEDYETIYGWGGQG